MLLRCYAPPKEHPVFGDSRVLVTCDITPQKMGYITTVEIVKASRPRRDAIVIKQIHSANLLDYMAAYQRLEEDGWVPVIGATYDGSVPDLAPDHDYCEGVHPALRR